MNKNSELLIKAFILVFVVTLTLVNLIFAYPCDDAGGGGYRCENWTRKLCRTLCKPLHGECDYYCWTGNYCHHGICYECWSIFCTDGFNWVDEDCMNSLPCPR